MYITLSTAIITVRESTVIKVPKSSCDDENYKFPDNTEQAESASRYQSSPGTTMQPNPAFGLAQSANEIYDNVN